MTVHKIRRVFRCAAMSAVVAGICAVLLPGALPPLVSAYADTADDALPALFATGGSGRYVEAIQWLQWGDYDKQFKGISRPNVPVLNEGEDREYINKRDLGEAGELVTTCKLSNLRHLGHATDVTDQQANGPLVATVPGAWAGDALDNLYNVGGPGRWSDGGEVWHDGLTYPDDYVNDNRMVIGLANGYAYNGDLTWDGQKWGTAGASTEPTGYSSRVSVDYSCEAELRAPDGTAIPVPVAGLVFADAEASSRRYGIKQWAQDEWADEWVQASTDQAVTWRVLDTLRSAECISKDTGKQVTTDAQIYDSGHTLRLMPSDLECVYQSGGSYAKPNGLGGPDAVIFMEGATRATVTMQGSGYSAVALGLIIGTDFGDAPQSYGHAGSLFQPKWEGGEISRTTDVFGVLPQASMYLDRSSPRLGERIDAEGYQPFSADALGDDHNGIFDDEDSLDIADGIRTAPGQQHSETVSCEGTGKAAGWVDWNGNGVFDETEKSDEVPCTGGEATLNWTVPADVVRAVDGEPGSAPDSYLRVRITNDNGGNGMKPTGMTATGEVEDYKVSIRVPTLQLRKTVDNDYVSEPAAGGSAQQWTVGANGTISLSGRANTGQPRAVGQETVTLYESSDDPRSAGYRAGQWECAETAGTDSEAYSSFVGQSTDGRAALTIRNQDRVTCTITNTAMPGSLTWRKLEADGTAIGGAQWTLSGPGVPDGTRVTDCIGTCESGPYADQDPQAGSFRLTGLHWGEYTIAEAVAPAGYRPVTGSFSFTSISGAALEGTLEDADGVRDGGVVNERLTGSVTWMKTDADTGGPLAGSTWHLSGPEVPDGTVVDDCATEPCAPGAYSDQDPTPGSFKVSGLVWNEVSYTLREAAAPAGYKVDSGSHEFVITAEELDYVFDTPFENSKTDVPSLPLTGGVGADAFLIGGGVLAVLAAGVAGFRRRREIRQ
ncbi:CshA/CshB family fibrillar adhesin-related protein [Actinomyces qiguomingii]|uniref:CshA/CshB family fibrillar adhesin-related protein n=1 Tax=Actinomyces qiguomingii TaxID=2057800 RepID=UPI000C9FFC71|nr:CshA/CshB family fibrillar adhesin-related protein [Actinomyces qiguomingii]